MGPIKVTPIYNKTIWAGEKLAAIRNRKPDGEGTSWEISIHPSAQSVIREGPYQGTTLAALIETDPEGMLGKGVSDIDYLRAAFLDAREPLSVQVHPGEAYARAHENDHGKAEAWYILDADEGASLVAGSDFHDGDEIRQALKDGTIEDHLYHLAVQEGDVVSVPSGTLHALGGGILALEIGTNSNTTYRFYDYNRTDADGNPRPLHIDQSLDVVHFHRKGTLVRTPLDGKPKVKRVVNFPEYTVDLIDVRGSYVLSAHAASFRTISCVKGDAVLTSAEGDVPLAFTESAFLPASAHDITIKGDCRILVGTPCPRSKMTIQKPACRSDLTGVRSDVEIRHGTKRLGDLASLYQNTEDMDLDLVLYEVAEISGDRFENGSLSVGLTTIYPVSINGECPFTRGHWHEDESCDEIYEGESGIGLLMYMNHDGMTWCEAIFPGSVHHITGGLAHRLINTGDTPLKVRAVWSPHAGHNYSAVDSQPFGFRIFRRNGRVEVCPHE